MSLRKRRPSMRLHWNRSLSLLTAWRRGKGDMVLENEVVLTKMKLFRNSHEKLVNVDDSVSTVSMTMSEQDTTEHAQTEEVISVHSAPSEHVAKDPRTDHLSAIFANPQLPRLYKFESEDSGVELPSGANSPSTPTGSEQSFVVHSRESSCDSGNRNFPIPAPDALSEECTASIDAERMPRGEAGECYSPELEERAEDEVDLHLKEDQADSEWAEDGALRSASEDREAVSDAAELQREGGEDPRPTSFQASTDTPDGGAGAQPHLRKSTTSDSLDEYMEECCRLSDEVSQRNAVRSGLGYLEHICQLIEKIGQLQEHNIHLQRQLHTLQREQRTARNTQEFLLQQCCCGAALLAFTELKRFSRGDVPAVLTASGTLSDLSTIPELPRSPLRSPHREGEGPSHWRRGLNRRSYAEGESRYLSSSSEGLSPPPPRQLSESCTWGRVKELVKRTRLRNSRLGLSSSSLKRSCPQLYRPDLGSVEVARRDRNSVIALGNQRQDSLWP